MKTKMTKHLVLPVMAIFAVMIIVSCNKEGLPEPDTKATTDMDLKNNAASQNQLLAQIRAATAKYHKFEAAAADGYMLDPHCVAAPGVGGMGFHAVNGMLIDDVVNAIEPEVLVYEPMKNGKLRLVAIEYIVFAPLWDEFNEDPPMLGNQVFADHRAPGSGGPPFPHYQLHVWLWKNNPMGMYFPLNPNVSCEHAYFYEMEE